MAHSYNAVAFMVSQNLIPYCFMMISWEIVNEDKIHNNLKKEKPV